MDRGDPQAEPVRTLFPSRAIKEGVDDRLTRLLADVHERIAQGSVVPTIDMERFRSELAGFRFESAQPLENLLGWTVEQLEHGLVHLTHPRYFGLFNPAPSFPAQCADRVVAVLNPQLATWTTSPVAVEIENHVIAAIAKRAGLPSDSRGHFTSGGSEANLSAVLCALTMAHSGFARDGALAFGAPVVFYASAESHLAWIKIAHQAGIGRSAVRLVATDGCGRMSPAALAEALAADRSQGRIPVMIAATAGTTSGGMVDPLIECAQIARREGLWYHVDAAWGGAALASDSLRDLLAGIESADSITIDAHKWFATTMACGMFITRRAAALDATFQVSTTFMPSNQASLDPYVSSVQWSRRFLGLRLFVALGAAGWAGYGRHVERAVALVNRIRAELAARDWRIANDSSLAVLCVEPPAGSAPTAEIARRVLASGRAWVAAAKFEGRNVIRICATHGELQDADVDELVAVLEASTSAVA